MKKIKILGSFLAIAILIAGCGGTSKKNTLNENSKNDKTTEQKEVEVKKEFKENTEYPRMVTLPESYFEVADVPVDYLAKSFRDGGKEVIEKNGGMSFEIDKEFMDKVLKSTKEDNGNADLAKTFDKDFKMEVTDDFTNVTFTIGEVGKSDDNVLGLMNAIVANYGYLQCLNGQSDWKIHTKVVDTSNKVLFEDDVPNTKIVLNK